MGKKNKHIDELFRQGLSGMDNTPPADAWNNIEQALDRKKKRRIVPIWIRLSGAAMIAVLVALGYFVLDSGNPEHHDDQIVDQENHLEHSAPSDKDSRKFNKRPIEGGKSDELNEAYPAESSSITSRSKNGQKDNDGEEALGQDIPESAVSNPVATTTQAQKSISTSADMPSKSDEREVSDLVPRAVPNSENEQVASSKEAKEEPLLKNKTLPERNFDLTTPGLTELATGEHDSLPKNVETEKLDLQEYADNQKQKEEEDEQKGLNTRWYLSSSVSPVMAHTLGGSSIDPQFADNPKNPGINLSYGVNLGYQISDKLVLRTGVMNTNMNYSTGDIAYTVTTSGENKFRAGQSGSVNIVVRDASRASNSAGPTDIDKEFPSNSSTADYEGEINQQLSYIEVPMELDYKVYDSKLSLHLVGGFSTLFLNQNNIIITNGPDRFELGEDPTFNQLNFSLNTGLGVGYDLTRQIGVRVEPQFKYQIRAQNNNPANFRPFTLGLHTGIFYRF